METVKNFNDRGLNITKIGRNHNSENKLNINGGNTNIQNLEMEKGKLLVLSIAYRAFF